MPTVAELERLQALVSRLVPLAGVQRGELIQAQDWNTVVGALIEVARAVLAEEHEGAVPVHAHPDQVTSGWLDPRLRSLLERGPLSDPTNVAKVAELERRLERLSTRGDQADVELKGMRDRISDVATRDLARQADITAVRRTIEGMADARDDVRALRETLSQLQQDVRVAVEVGARLTVDGQPVDMQAVVDRLKDVEGLRDRLRMPNGELLDAKALEIRLTELTTTLVTESELDAALDERLKGAMPGLRDQLLTDVDGRVTTTTAALRTDVLSQMSQMLDGLRGETDTRFADVDAAMAEWSGRLDQSIATAQSGLLEQLNQARSGLDALIVQRIGDAQSTYSRQLADATGQLRQDFAARLDQSIAGVRNDVGTLITDQLKAAVDGVSQSAREQIDSMAGTLRAEMAGQFQSTADALRAEMDGHIQSLAGTLRAEVAGQFQSTADALRAEMDKRFQSEGNNLRAQWESEISIMRNDINDRLTNTQNTVNARIVEAAADVRQTLHAELSAEIVQQRLWLEQQVKQVNEDVSTSVYAEFDRQFDNRVSPFRGSLGHLEDFAKVLDERITALERGSGPTIPRRKKATRK